MLIDLFVIKLCLQYLYTIRHGAVILCIWWQMSESSISSSSIVSFVSRSMVMKEQTAMQKHTRRLRHFYSSLLCVLFCVSLILSSSVCYRHLVFQLLRKCLRNTVKTAKKNKKWTSWHKYAEKYLYTLILWNIKSAIRRTCI